MMRPVLPRTSSAASGLRFCGMIEEPVVNLSVSLTRPTSGEVHITISSAKRDRCTEAIDAAAKRLHREVAVGHGVERIRRRPVEAERLRRHVAVERKRRAGERRRAERHFVEALARIGKTAAVARRHLDIGQQMMAEGHRLRRLQMGEARHHRAGMLERLGRPAQADRPPTPRRSCRSSRASTAGSRSPPDRCANARCAGGRRTGRSDRSAGFRHSCECLRARA